MHATLPLMQEYGFPALRRGELGTLQVNLGYRCNQSCLHCHVNAGPQRSEMMSRETITDVLALLKVAGVGQLDLTGGAPELNPHFRELVMRARAIGVQVIDRCNLTVLDEPGQEGLAEFLAHQAVEITASLPCYLEDNVDKQRGKGVFQRSIAALRRLNALGYAGDDARLALNLVHNPQGAVLPPEQAELEAAYRRDLGERFGIRFTRLYTLTNMPIQRFGSTLVSNGTFRQYMALLRSAHREQNLDGVMCRSLLSVDWQGYAYDCDFNQMLGLPLSIGGRERLHISELIGRDLRGNPIAVKDHCYGCSAGNGSSCGGALNR